MKVPLMRPKIVRTVQAETASIRIPGMRWPLNSRRTTAPYDHASTASIAAPGPTRTRNT